MLFEKEYSFRGSHAEKVVKLTAQFDGNSSAKLFNRNLDVYIVAPVIGFLYGKKSEQERSSETTKIFPEQLSREQPTLKYHYRLIMLLDDKHEPSFDERLNKAFRYYGNDSAETLADEKLYEQYVLGGVEILYEKLIEDGSSSDDYVARLYDFLEEFDQRFNESVSDDAILDLCTLARS